MSATLQQFDLIIIGGGSAGYAAARTAVDAGARVALVDHGPLGGLCILRGCMPSKTLLRSSELAADMRRAKEFGLSPVEVHADLASIVDRKDRLVREFADDRIRSLRDGRFTLIEGEALFRTPHEIRVDGTVLRGAAFILATGSIPAEIPIPGLAESGYMTSDTIMDLRAQPASLIVLGGGSVATELGQFFARLGTRVIILQRGDALLSYFDHDLGYALEEVFRTEGIDVVTRADFLRVSAEGAQKTVHITHHGRNRSVTADLILHAMGRQPNLAGLNLPAAGVTVNGRRPTVGSDMRTTQPHIFAVGDANGLTASVHVAIQQAEIAAYNALHPDRTPKRLDHRLDLEVIFTDPQVAVLGMSETACRAEKVPYLAASYRFADHGKAMCLGRTHGFVKLLCQPKSGVLLGAQVIGAEAGELIHELAAVMYYHGTVYDLTRIPHYHPTLAEIITYPAEELVGRVQDAS
ncbi:mercuric reductase [Nitrospira sp.]|nr:mercuric reductase [Nitrospira sp.]